jgi:hypothetical protein
MRDRFPTTKSGFGIHVADKCRRFAFGPRKSLGLDFSGRIHCHAPFSVSQEKHSDAVHVLFGRGRRGLALKRLDIRGNCDRFDIFSCAVFYQNASVSLDK